MGEKRKLRTARGSGITATTIDTQTVHLTRCLLNTCLGISGAVGGKRKSGPRSPVSAC